MSDEVKWLPNWNSTRLHAVVGPTSEGSVLALCSAQAYNLPEEFARRLRAKGNIPRCKNCETFFKNPEQKTERPHPSTVKFVEEWLLESKFRETAGLAWTGFYVRDAAKMIEDAVCRMADPNNSFNHGGTK